MKTIKAYGNNKDGSVKLSRSIKADLKAMGDCDIELSIKKKGKRSSPQNRYYFGVVIHEIRVELERRGERFDPETIHEFLKQKFNPKRMILDGGELIELPGTTTDLNKEEFSEYLEKIIEWSALSLELSIPPPGEQTSFFLPSPVD